MITSALASIDWRFRLARFLERIDWKVCLTRFMERSRGVIVTYHAIDSPEGYASDPQVTLGHFQRQLELLNDRYRFSSLEELVDNKIPSPKRVVLTFDDGHRSFIDKALPMLAERGIPATLFICSGWLGTKRFMTRDEIRDIARRPGIEIGNHTRTHSDLGSEQSRGILEREIVGGKKDLEDLLGREVSSFSYPYGKFSVTSVDLVRSSHACAVTVKPGVVWPDADPFLLNRVPAAGIPISRFAFNLTDVRQRLR